MRAAAAAASSVLAENDRNARSEDDRTKRFLLKNATATAAVFLEVGAPATTGAGFEWAVADGPLEIALEPGEKLYGIVAATPQTIHVLKQGR